MAKKICTTAGFLSLFDGTAAETASADADATAHTAHLRVNTLQVGPLHHLGLNVRVTDLIADEAALVTEIATICHGYFPAKNESSTRRRVFFDPTEEMTLYHGLAARIKRKNAVLGQCGGFRCREPKW